MFRDTTNALLHWTYLHTYGFSKVKGILDHHRFSFILVSTISLIAMIGPGFAHFVFPQSFYVILSILITCATLCLSVKCMIEFNIKGPPTPADCRHIIAHLPAVPHARNNSSDLGAPPIMTSSSPFFPNAMISHGSCGVQFSIRDASDAQDLFRSTTYHPILFPEGLLELDALKAWASIKADADTIITECIDEHLVGWANARVSEASYAGLLYAVNVFRTLPNQDQGATLEALDRASPFGQRLELFSRPYYAI